eukprot:UN03109
MIIINDEQSTPISQFQTPIKNQQQQSTPITSPTSYIFGNALPTSPFVNNMNQTATKTNATPIDHFVSPFNSNNKSNKSNGDVNPNTGGTATTDVNTNTDKNNNSSTASSFTGFASPFSATNINDVNNNTDNPFGSPITTTNPFFFSTSNNNNDTNNNSKD